MNDSSKENHTIIIHKDFKPKLDKYCQLTFGKSFDDALDHRIAEVIKKFVGDIKEHIELAEKNFGQDYLEIKE